MTPQRIVVKLGTSTLTAGNTKLSMPHMVDLVRQMAQLHTAGSQFVLVSSGAMAAGRETLDFPELPKFIPAKQMLAAVGQPRLMAIYNQLFDLYGETVAQVLLTRSDLSNRRRYLNARNTLEALLAQGVIPIVNENDTVATEEIRVGDNDNLSAMLANLIEANLLILLTDQQGLYTADPAQHPDAQLVTEVSDPEIPEALWLAAGGTGNGLGTGGMFTKLQAADLARRSGTTVVIAQGTLPDIITRIIGGEVVGTRFTALLSHMESRKRYILAGPQPTGKLSVDPGAVMALQNGESSLLPVGVIGVEGRFERGETVRVVAPEGKEIARGVVNYAADDLARLCGQQSTAIENILGYTYGDAVIHRDDLIVL